MKIGLIGEAPADTLSIKNLLSKKYKDFTFVELLKNKITGSSLENQKTKTELRIECITQRPDIVIFIRDLDGLLTPEFRKKRLQRQNYYKSFKGCTQVKKTIFFLHIWEIEALILADINAFNIYYKCNIEFDGNPMTIKEPKEYLSNLYPKYSESHNGNIMEGIDFEKVYENCIYFKHFINKFDRLLN